MKKKRSVSLLIATILASLYAIYLFSYFYGTDDGGLGGAIAAALITPHLACVTLGAIFGWLGYCSRTGWAALVAAILYSVGAVLFFTYALFCVPMIVFGFIGFAKQKKLNAKHAAAAEASV